MCRCRCRSKYCGKHRGVVPATSFRSRNDLVQELISNVTHVPDLRYRLFPQPTIVKSGHTFEGRPTGVVIRLKLERSNLFPLSATLYRLYGYRVACSRRKKVCADLAPEQTKRKNGNETKNGNGRFFLESKPIVYNSKEKS